MSGIRTSLATCAALLATSSAFAMGHIHVVFAECVGRFSAEMEHAWLLGKSEADLYEHHRRTFITLMEASMPADAARKMLNYRIDHKLAHASLLTTASFGQDDQQAEMAKATARTYRQNCERLLLDS